MTPNGKPMNFGNTCTLRKPDGTPCGYRIENVPLGVPIIGQAPEDRAIRLAEALGKHIYKAHPTIAQALEQGAKIYQAFLIAQLFRIEDPNAFTLVSHFRHEIMQAIPRAYLPDDALAKLVDGWQLGEHGPKVLDGVKTVRDYLTETKVPAPTPVPAVKLA